MYSRLDIYYSNGTGFLPNPTKILIESPLTQEENRVKNINIGDYNGDGIADIFVIRKNNWWQAFYGTTTGPASISTFQGHYQDSEQQEIVITADFDNDGKDDLMFTDSQGSDILKISDNELISLFSIAPGYPTTWHDIYYGDFNGDGITDILTNEESAGWEVAFFNGNDFDWSNTIPLNLNKNGLTDNNFKLSIGDFNGDSKDDIITIEYDYFTGSKCYLYFSNGGAFTKEDITYIDPLPTERIYIGDFNGDGSADVLKDVFKIFNFEHFYEKRMCFFHAFDQSRLINSFTNGFGAKTQVAYDLLTNTECYTKGNGALYPLVNIQPAINVVVSEFHQIGNILRETNTYQYENLIQHQKGKGLIGFGKRKIIDKLSGIYTEQQNDIYTIENKFYFLYPKTIKSDKPTTGEPLSESTNILNHKQNPDSPYIFFPFIETTTSRENDFNTLVHIRSSKATYEYDLLGNLLHKRELIHPNPMGPGAPSQAYYHQSDINISYYAPDTDHWILGQPYTKTSTTRYKTEPNITTGEKFVFYQYNESGFPLLKEKFTIPSNNLNDPLLTKELYTYDDYGNLISTTILAPNSQYPLEPRTVSATYGSDYQHRFPTLQTNPENYVSSGTFNPVYGWTLTTTDPNGLVTKFSQDALGTYSKTVLPEGIQQIKVLRWAEGHKYAPNPPLLKAMYYSWQQISGQAPVFTFYHETGVELRTVTIGFDGTEIYVDKIYNNKGQLYKETQPYKKGDIRKYTEYTYDTPGRLTTVIMPDNSILTTDYQGNTVISSISKNSITQTTSKKQNAAGWVTESKDNDGNIVKYDYFSDGNLKTAKILGQDISTVTLGYNSRRQRNLLTDPNYGTAHYTYDAFGQLIEQKSPKNIITTFAYDKLGRMITQDETGNLTQWTYSSTPGRYGALESVAIPGHTTIYTYDNFLNPITETEVIDDVSYQTAFTYDLLGRPDKTTYPSNFSIRNIYNEHGFFAAIKQANGSNNDMLWQTQFENHFGQITDFTTGNGLITYRVFDPLTHKLTDVITKINGQNPVQDLEYDWDEIGNLHFRKKWFNRAKNQSITERFTYDDLNRLEYIYLNNIEQGHHRYDEDGLGNLVYKRSDGQLIFEDAVYGENNTGPNALTSFPLTSALPVAPQSIEYSSFEKATSITEGLVHLNIRYGHHQQRITQEYADVSNTKSKLWAGSCEYITENGQQTILTYLSGPEGVFALHIKKHDGTENIRFIHKDHLGSWHTITDEQGDPLQELSFDAWGNRRNPATWRAFSVTPPVPMFDRGFTGHEHLYAFNLINMNGRIYDPIVSRMLSPDNFIQSPDYSQNFNRYSYCLNNPLVYTDPDGEWVHIVVGAVVGGVINLATNWNSIDNFWEGAAAFGVGAGAGALTAATGGAAAGTFLASSGAAVGAAVIGGGATTATNNIISQTGNGIGLNDVSWEEVGEQAIVGGLLGGVSYGTGSAIKQTGLTNKILDAAGITNYVTRNIVGSTVNGAMIGTTAGFVNGVTTGVVTEEWNLWEHTWKGAAYGGAAGLMYGGLTELGYQAQLKWGHKRSLNSNVTESVATGGKDYINRLKHVNGSDGQGGQGSIYNGTGLGEIIVVYNTRTGTTTVYINVCPNSYWQPPSPYQYNSSKMPNIIKWLQLKR